MTGAELVHRSGGPVDVVLQGPTTPIPASGAPFELVVECGELRRRLSGFWDGGARYVARFLPEVDGSWRWRTESPHPELDARQGSIEVQGAAGARVVRVADRFHFARADGIPFRPVGATVYNWIHQDEPLYSATVAALTDAGLNKLRILVFPQAGDHVTTEPRLLPFARSEGGRWDVSRPDPAFFRRLEDSVELLGRHGIEADVLVFTAYDGGRFGLDALTEAEEEAYLRHLVARLAAFPNVWWSLCNEFDLLDRPRDRWRRMGEFLAEIDPYRHPRSIHNWISLYDATEPWLTHASIQNGQAAADFARASMYRDVYGKPVVLDEIKYEGDISERWGHLDARELVHRFWITTVSGAYASHGESFHRPGGGLHIVEGGAFEGESPQRLGFLRRILDELVVPGLDPIDPWEDPEFVAGVPRRQYLRYLGREAPPSWAFRLPQASHVGDRLEPGDEFRVDVIDTWNMTVTPLERTFVLDDVQRNDAYARAAAPLALPAGEALALRITRV